MPDIAPRIAYFSMEIGLEPEIPTYSGGLGVLAGDTIRSAADLKLPMIAITLVHRQGYFDQQLEADGTQVERPVQWDVAAHFSELPARVTVSLHGRNVVLRAWQHVIKGRGGGAVSVLLLDSDLPENEEVDRRLTDHLYGGDSRLRLCQEAILGIGGVRMLRALGHQGIARFHLNEGHASLLILELLNERIAARGQGGAGDPLPEDIAAVRSRCVFTTHTPVSAGHDKFDPALVKSVIGPNRLLDQAGLFFHEGQLNMTRAALNLSRYVNGVAKRHGEVSRRMFRPHPVDSITNGIHAATWVGAALGSVLDRHIPGWRDDNFSLRHATAVPAAEYWEAHQRAKRDLIDHVNQQTRAALSPDHFTIGFARRATAYKRPHLLISDLDRLRHIAAGVGPLQIIYAGKAHPRDEEGKGLIRAIHRAAEVLRPQVQLAYLENYNMRSGAMLTAGADLWLNTPLPPLEASGTSGMKAALNGVPSLSTLDGWWLEGCIEGVTGWAIGEDRYVPGVEPDTSAGEGASHEPPASFARDAASLYEKLQQVILPMYLHDRAAYLDIMLHAIALNGSYFNTQRMLLEYAIKAYLP